MTDELTQAFDDFARGVFSPETFGHELLMLCKTKPDRAWEALAMLDQHFRRGKIPRELQHSLRQRIERQALGIESYEPQRTSLPEIAIARVIPVAPHADAEDPKIETSAAVKPTAGPALIGASGPSIRGPAYFRISAAFAMTMMLAMAVSPLVQKGLEHWPASSVSAVAAGAGSVSGDASATAPPRQPEPGPDMLSFSSDRYIVDPDREVAELSVERSPNAVGDTSFLWWTEGSGAKPDQDYVAGKPRRLQMAEGIGSSTLRIPILANPNRHHVEMFYVLIGRPQGTTGVGPIHRAAVFLLPQQVR